MTAPALVRRIGGLELTIRGRGLGLLRFVPGGTLLGVSEGDGTVGAERTVAAGALRAAGPHAARVSSRRARSHARRGGLRAEPRIATIAGDLLTLVRADDGAPIAERAPPEGQGSPTGAIAFADRHRAILVGTFAGLVVVVEDGGPPALLDPGLGPPAPVSAIAVVPDRGLAVVGHADGVLRIWDLDAREVIAGWRAHEAKVSALACSRDGTLLASGSEDTTVAIWRLP